MQKLRITFIFTLILVGTQFFLCSALANKGNYTKEIDKKIIAQLGEKYDLKSWDVVSVKEKDSGIVSIKNSHIKITAVVKETLYKPGRAGNGRQTVSISKKVGDPVEFKGSMVEIEMAGMAKNAKKASVQVIVNLHNSYGMPLSRYPSNVKTVEQKKQLKQQSIKPDVPRPTISKAKSTNRSRSRPSKPVQKPEDNFFALMSVYSKNNEIWGVNAGKPVILKNIKQDTQNTLKGTIHYPFRKLANPFIIQKGNGMIMLKINPATPANRGVRRDSLVCNKEGEELVAKSNRVFSEIRFALTTGQNLKLKKSLNKQIDPLKSVNNVKDYFSIGGKIYNVESLEEIRSSWKQFGNAIRVKKLPERFISTELGYSLTVAPFGAFPAHQVQTLEPVNRMPIQPLSKYKKNVWVSNNFSEYVVLRDGDVWHGKIDWQNNTVKQERNITNLGMLNTLKPIAWYKNDFYFYNNTSPDKPILSINLVTGEIDEKEATKALHNNSLGSPDGRFIFFSDGRQKYSPSGSKSLIYVYDCRNRQSFTMDASIDERNYTGKMKDHPRPLKIIPREWVSDSMFITNIGWYDLKKKERTLFIEKKGIIRKMPEQFYRVIKYSFLPVSDFIDITVQSFNKKEKKELIRRYRVHRTKQEAIELPLEFDKNKNIHSYITWIDENRYVFSKRKGSLKEIGTWLFDIKTNKHRRLTPMSSDGYLAAKNFCMKSEKTRVWPFPFYFYNQHLVFNDKDRIVFSAKKGNSSKLISVPINGGNIEEVNLTGRIERFIRIMPFSIELPVLN